MSNLITRARITGEIPFEAIGDDTRPSTTWSTWTDVRGLIRAEANELLNGYWRELMISQPNHVEIMVEKNTVEPILRPVAMEYCIPIGSARGFNSHAPYHAIRQRYEKSGKEKLVLIVASDFDPSGECIAESMCRILRDDYAIADIWPIKCALTYEQTLEYDLPVGVEPKTSDSRAKEFIARYGNKAYELEAVEEDTLQELLRNAIDSVIDRDAFNAELNAEKEDAAYLEGVRRQVHGALEGIVE